jgi:hypothetical protein
MKDQAPVWRKNYWKMDGKTYIHFTVDFTHGSKPIFLKNPNSVATKPSFFHDLFLCASKVK